MQPLPSPIRVRVIFVTTAVFLAAQTLYIREYGEPYPALVMPGFGGSGGYRDRHVELSRYEAVFITEQEEFTFPPQVLLGEFPDSHHGHIAAASLTPHKERRPVSAARSKFGRIRDAVFPGYAFARRSHGSPVYLASLGAWLRGRADVLLPGRKVTHVEIRWFRERVRIDGSEFRTERVPTDSLLVDLDGELR